MTIFFLMRDQLEQDEEYANRLNYYLQEDALMALEKGDKLLNTNNFEAAINQYKVALAMDLKNDKIRQHIAQAYKRQCMLIGDECETAMIIYDFLIDTYPLDIPLLKERLELNEHIGDSIGIENDKSMIRKAQFKLNNGQPD